MKRLKNKVFWVIFGILTSCLVCILIIFNIQDYNREKNKMDNNLMRLSPEPGNLEIKRNNKDFIIQENENLIKPENNQNKNFFMDYVIYVVLYDKNERKVINITSHSQDDEISQQEIEKIAEEIIEKNKSKDSKHIGNLYFERYSYLINNDKITIAFNSKIQERLYETLKISIMIFIMLELIIIIVSIKLTNWIIKPVIKAFDKQKQFIEDASHELKTPLAVIIASIEALEKEPNEKKWLNNIKDESERMNNLISNLLDMAKSERAEVQFQKEQLSKLVEKSILTFESLMFEKNIKFEYDIEENIEMNCNSVQIKQLIGILIDNAIKHCNKKGFIKVNLNKEKNNIILKVSNNGKVIPKIEQEKIFERFYRVDESRNRSDNRYGLGLAIAKNIVENHNGIIGVESENEITTFIVNFK